MFAVFCPRHGATVLLDVRRIRSVANLATGVIAIELACYDDERLVLVTGSRATGTPSPARPDPTPDHEVIVPRQQVIVRLNWRDPDSSPQDYLPAIRPYSVVAMARALRREIPVLSPPDAVRVAVRAHRGQRAVALVAPRPEAEEVQARLRAFHQMRTTVERVR